MADNAPAADAGPSKSALKKAEKQAKMAAEKAAKAAKQAALPLVGGKKQDDTIGMSVTKAENFPQWYQDVVLKAEMIEYYNEISGFFILRPSAMYIWNTIRKWFQERIEALEVEECSFPMFLSSKSLEKEKDHVEGFAPELAWVTKAFVPPSLCMIFSLTKYTVVIKTSRFLLPSVQPLKLSCTHITQSGSAPTAIFPFVSINGTVSLDGRLSKPHHSFALASSCGRKDTLHT